MTEHSRTTQTPLAIIGMACRLPGADSLDEYWRLIDEGRCAIGELPEDRLERSLYYDPRKGIRGKSYTSLGALSSWPSCDLLPPNIIQSSDPAHLTFCHVAAEAVRHAGLDVCNDTSSSFVYPNTGVYVGNTNGTLWGGEIVHGILIEQIAALLRDVDEFNSLPGNQSEQIIERIVSQVRSQSPRRQPDGGPFLLANRVASLVSMALGLTGPGIAVNAACASSLIALSIAARALEQDQIDMAIVGGLSYCRSNSMVLFSKAQSMSATGSRPFDETADGLVIGEGCAALAIRRLDRALADNNPIQAVISGIGIACDGKGKSLWAPRKEGQVEAMRRAYGGEPDLHRLGYVEAHATSTQVGDATELTALSEVLKSRVNCKVPIGSVKANIGHTLETAGVAGLVKTVLAIRRKTIPRAININRLNPKIDWSDSPLIVPRESQPWPAPRDPQSGRELPRRAAVNSFGIGGLNGHVVLDEYPINADQTSSEDRIQVVERPGQVATGSGAPVEPIAVIGAAAIFPGASSLEEFHEVLKSGRDQKSEIPPSRWNWKLGYSADRIDAWHTHVKRGGFISDYAYDWRKHKVPPKQVAQADPLQFMLLDVVDQALVDGGYRDQTAGRRRTGVVIGNAFGGEFGSQLQMGLRIPAFRQMLGEQLRRWNSKEETIERIADAFEDRMLERMPALLDESGSYSTSTLASRITKTFDLMGGAFAVDAGNHSTFAALSACLDILRGGHCDLMICGAGQRCLDLSFYNQLSLSGAAGQVDDLFEAMIPGEGAGALLLKRLSDARRDGDRVRAVIHATNMFQGSELGRVIHETSRQRSRDVSHLAANFSGSRSVQPTIEESLSQVFGEHLVEEAQLNSVAQQIGNTGGASGMAMLLKAILETESFDRSTHRQPPKKFSCFSIDASSNGRNHQAYHLQAESPPSPTLAGGEGVLNTDAAQAVAAGSTNTGEPFVVRLAGTPYEMGMLHGQRESAAIRKILRRYADLPGWPIVEHKNFDEIASDPESQFTEAQFEEMRGIADGAKVSHCALIAHNLRLAGDISSGGCVHAALDFEHGGMLHAANEDLPIGLSFKDCLARIVQLRQPAGQFKSAVFTVVGQVCGINGMNEHRLSVSSSMLLDRCASDRVVNGQLHNTLVQKILEEASDVGGAIEIVRQFAPKAAGAWSLWLGDGKTGRKCYVEYDSNGQVKTSEDSATVGSANHSLLLESRNAPHPHSCSRLARFEQVVNEARNLSNPMLTIQAALREQFDAVRGRATRHPTMNTLRRVDNQISVVMQPDQGKVFFTAGSLADDENRFFELQVTETVEPVAAGTEKVANENVCDRFVMRMERSPQRSSSPSEFQFNSAALVLGDNEIAEALVRKIELGGGQAFRLSSRDNPDELLEQLEHLWESTPAGHLFLLTPFDDLAATNLTEVQWNWRRAQCVMLPFLVTQRWQGLVASAGMMDGASVVACTTSGGDFGFIGNQANPESGALSGLVKGLNVEFGGRSQDKICTKVLDFEPSISPSEIVNSIAVEMASDAVDVEIGYPAAGDRHVVRMTGQRLSEPTTPLRSPNEIPTGNWVVTGGARGVTAAVAKRFGEKFGVKLHLLGSSPLPDVEPDWRGLNEDGIAELRKQVCKKAAQSGEMPIRAWQRVEKAIEIDRNLREFQGAGIEAVYHACDVGDPAALARVLDNIRGVDGSIDGIIHGAGFEKSCRFEKKTIENVERTIASKVDGAAALMELTKTDRLQAFMAFGSISGRIGALGQTDYCLANDMLAKLVGWYRAWRPECPTVVFHWPAWGEVGMAMRPETRGLLERFDLRFLPLLEGADFLINELLNGLPEKEVLIADAQSLQERLPVGVAVESTYPETEIRLKEKTATSPLIDEIIEPVSQGRVTVACHLDPTREPFLKQHLFRGTPLLPIVIGMESMLQAASLLAPAGQMVVELRDVEAIAGLSFHTDRVRKPKIRAELKPDGIHCELSCDFHNRAGDLMRADVVHLRGRVGLGNSRYKNRPPELDAPLGGHDVDYPQAREEVLYHGPIFRNASQIFVDEAGGWSWLTAPRLNELAGERTTEGWILSPGLLDSMMFSCGIYNWLHFDQAIAIPQRIGSIRLGRPIRPGEACIQKFKILERQGDRVFYDFALFGENNDVIYEIQKYQSIIVNRKSSAV